MVDDLVQALVAVGGLVGLSSPIVVLLQRRKINAEAKKTGVDAAAVISDTAIELLQAAKVTATEAKVDVEKLGGEVRALRRHVARLEELLARHGIEAPPFVWPGPSRNGSSR